MYSELAARMALVANGWTVHTSETKEAYDILATDPLTGDHKRIQVKTIKLRDDRRNEMVVYARRGSGEPYRQSDADYIVGVLVTEDAPPRVWMFENRGIGEYWSSEARASQRWVELPIGLNRGSYEVAAGASA